MDGKPYADFDADGLTVKVPAPTPPFPRPGGGVLGGVRGMASAGRYIAGGRGPGKVAPPPPRCV